MSLSVFSVLSALLAVVVIYKLLKWISFALKISKVPGPGSIPFVGVFFDILNLNSVGLFNLHRKYAREYGSLYKYTVMGDTRFHVNGPEEFEAVASKMKNLAKSHDYDLLEEWLGKGLLLNTGSEWQVRRKIMTPAFHFGILQEFVTVFNIETDRCLEVLKEEAKKSSTNIVPIISQMTLFTIAESSFGTQLDANNKSDKDYIAAIYNIGKIIVYRTFRPWLQNDFIFNTFSSLSSKNKKAIETLHGFTEKIIKEKTTNFQTFEPVVEDSKKRKKMAFLDLLLNAKLSKGIIDDEGINAEVNTFMFEGHDTTSNGIAFALFLLTQYPEYQDLIYEEVTSILGDNKHPELQDLNEFKLMERFIKESLRYHPSVPLIGRILDEDVILKGYEIPKDSQVQINIYDIHRDPNHWTEPNKFDPDRFLPENCVDRHPYAFVPFSAGPRNCIGQKFAMLEMKVMLCGIVRNFTFTAIDKKLDFEFDLVLRPANESILLKFTPRPSV